MTTTTDEIPVPEPADAATAAEAPIIHPFSLTPDLDSVTVAMPADPVLRLEWLKAETKNTRAEVILGIEVARKKLVQMRQSVGRVRNRQAEAKKARKKQVKA